MLHHLSFIFCVMIIVIATALVSAASSPSSFTIDSFAKFLLAGEITPENVNENTDDELGYTRLHKASFYGRLDVVQELVKTHKASVEVITNGSAELFRTPLQVAAGRGHFEVVKFLMEEGGAEPEVLDNRQQSALWHAASNGHVDVVKYLLEDTKHSRKSEANTENFQRVSPLLAACISGAHDVVEYLVNFPKTNIDFRNVFGKTCLHLAAESQNKTAIESPLANAASVFDHLKVAKVIVGKKSDMVETVDGNDQTALFSAAESGASIEMIKFLVEKNPKRVTTQNAFGQTPLHLAASKGHLRIVTHLVENCLENKLEFIDEIVDDEGKTPFLLAAQDGHVSVLDYLFTKGVDILRTDKTTYNAFILAALHTQLATAQRLIIWNPDFITSTDQYGHNALHLALYQGQSLPMIKFLQFYSPSSSPLLRQGRQHDRNLPIHFAAISRGDEIIPILKYLTQELTEKDGGGAELVDLMNAHGQTALEHARAGPEANLKKEAVIRFMVEDLKRDGSSCARKRAARLEQQEQGQEQRKESTCGGGGADL